MIRGCLSILGRSSPKHADNNSNIDPKKTNEAYQGVSGQCVFASRPCKHCMKAETIQLNKLHIAIHITRQMRRLQMVSAHGMTKKWPDKAKR